MINVRIEGEDNDWCGYVYCLKENEYIEFLNVIEGFVYKHDLINIGRLVERSYD